MTTAADRHLLFGLLALQNGMINQAQLVHAFQAWTLDKSKGLADHLEARGDLTGARRALLEALFEVHLEAYGAEMEKSLAAVSAGKSTRESLARLGDPDIEATLGHVGSGHGSTDDGDPDRTTSYAIGTATSDGERFRILRPHAKGGLGAVFVALDSELNREVALKQILDHHADDPTSRQRFLIEAEITGGLEHPGIVPVYGLGVYADGRPYYAMRFIKGDSLKEAIEHFHTDESLKAADRGPRSLELRKLLRRFIDTCNAIDYAHSRGVVHRDIKPGNIILGKHGETLVVDWGLAKATGKAEPASGERILALSSASGSAETLPGSAMGTPSYMSPEQAAGDLDRLGPRSDVYSLGATLYCLLTGKTAFEGDDVGTLLRKVQKGDFRPPRQLAPSVDRALEAVCLKAMDRRPESRYPSARALAEDVDRWLADEPVSARVDPWSESTRRWARHHRTMVVTSTCLLIASVIGLAVGLVLLRDKQRQTEVARRDAVENFRDAESARQAAASARDEAEANFARAMDAVETMLVRVSEKHLANLPHFEPVRRQLMEDALTFYQGFLARAGDAPPLVVQAARAYRFASAIHRELAKPELARQELQKSLDLLGNMPAAPDRNLELAAVLQSRAWLHISQRRTPEAIEELARGLALLGTAPDQRVKDRAHRARLAQVAELQSALGGQLNFVNRFNEARDASRKARSALEQLLEVDPRDELSQFRLAVVENNEAVTEGLLNNYPGAVEHYGRAVRLLGQLRAKAPDVIHYRRDQANSKRQLATALASLGRISEALDTGGQAIALFGELAADYPTIPRFRYELAAAHHGLGIVSADSRPESAREQFHRSIDALETLLRREPSNLNYLRDLANSHMWLGNTERALRRFDESASEYTRARDLFTETARLRPKDPEPPYNLAASEHNRADTLAASGRLELAEQGYRRSQQLLNVLVKQYPQSNGYLHDLANSTLKLGHCLLARGDRVAGEAESTRSLELWDSLFARSPQDPDYLEYRGRVLVVLGRFDQAIQSAETLAALPEKSSKNLYQAACLLAFNLPRPGPDPDPFAAARAPSDQAAGLADRAFRFLQMSLSSGYSNRKEIQTDSDLEALRSRADYARLLDFLLDRGFPANPFVP